MLLESSLSVCSICVLWAKQWIKMALGTEVDLGLGNNVLDGDPSAPWKGAQQPPPHFSPYLLWPNGHPSQQLLSSYWNTVEDQLTKIHLETRTTTTILRPFVRDYPGEPVPEETLTNPQS